MTKKLTKLLFLAAVFGFSINAKAGLVNFDISWSGANNYSLVGMFNFDESLLGTGPIDETQVNYVSIDVLLNGVSQGVWNSGQGLLTNFNFDTTTEQFLVGGFAASTSGQQWGHSGSCLENAAGFYSGNGTQGVCLGGSNIGASAIPVSQSTLSASRASISEPVPAPAPLALLGVGLLGIFLGSKRRT